MAQGKTPVPHDDKLVATLLNSYRSMLTAGNPEAVTAVLGDVGRAAAVDRVYVFSFSTGENGTIYASQTHEWTSPAVVPQIDNPDLQNIPMLAAGYGRWMDELRAWRPIVGRVSDFPVKEHHLLTAQQILSILVLPIFADGRLYGMVGFDDCTRGHGWTGADVDLLITTALSLGLVLGKVRTGSPEQTTDTYLSLVGRLLKLHQLMLTETAVESLLYRTRIRMQVLTRCYRFLSGPDPNHGTAGLISLPDLLYELKPLFASVRVVGLDEEASSTVTDLDIDPIELSVPRALDVAIILTEIFAVISDLKQKEQDGALLSVALYHREDRAELTITARNRNGEPVGKGTPLDPMAVQLFRSLQEHFNAQIATSGFDGLLFRLSFKI